MIKFYYHRISECAGWRDWLFEWIHRPEFTWLTILGATIVYYPKDDDDLDGFGYA